VSGEKPTPKRRPGARRIGPPLAAPGTGVRRRVTEPRAGELATKIAGVIAQKKADLEARRLMRVFARVSRAIEDDPSGVFERLRQRPDVPRPEVEEVGRLLNRR
jgi:hypothetical protein